MPWRTAFDAWRDVGLHCLRCQNITAKSFWILSIGLNEVFESFERLNVRFKTAWQTCVMKGGIWSWKGATGPSTRCPGGGAI